MTSEHSHNHECPVCERRFFCRVVTCNWKYYKLCGECKDKKCNWSGREDER